MPVQGQISVTTQHWTSFLSACLRFLSTKFSAFISHLKTSETYDNKTFFSFLKSTRYYFPANIISHPEGFDVSIMFLFVKSVRLNNSTPQTLIAHSLIETWNEVLLICAHYRHPQSPHRWQPNNTTSSRKTISSSAILHQNISFLFFVCCQLKVFNWNSIVHNLVTQTCTKAINLHNEITTKYLIAFQSTIQQFQTRELIMERELKRQTLNWTWSSFFLKSLWEDECLNKTKTSRLAQ